jgi:hypothetical protein
MEHLVHNRRNNLPGKAELVFQLPALFYLSVCRQQRHSAMLEEICQQGVWARFVPAENVAPVGRPLASNRCKR